MDQTYRNRVVTVLFIGVLMGALDIAIVGPALPAIQNQFSLQERSLSWIFSVYVLFNLVGTPLMAKLSDLFGRRIIYILDVTLFAAGSLIVAVSPVFWVVLLGRGIQGFGAGGIFPVASAVIGDTFPVEKRGSALGLIGAVFGIAFILGPILGGIILAVASWQWLFFINLPIAAAVIALSIKYLPKSEPRTVLQFDWPGMIFLAILLASLAYSINQIETANFWNSFLSKNVWPFLTAFAVLLFIFIEVEKRAASPIIPLYLFRRRQLSLANVLSSGAGIVESSLVFLPALAVAGLGISQVSASFMLMPLVLALSIGAPLAGKLLDRNGSRIVLSAGTLLTAIGTLLLGIYTTSMVMYFVSTIIIGFGLSALLGAPIRYIMLSEASAAERSVAQGITNVFISIGQLVGSAMIGAVAASGITAISGYSMGYRIIAFVSLLLFGLTFLLKKQTAEKAAAISHQPVQNIK